jgi:hypothetical protein
LTKYEFFCLEGVLHRELDPAAIWYYPDGPICYKQFYTKGVMHREVGPAEILYYSNGSIEKENFYLDGQCLGRDKKGFWVFWNKLTDEQRQKPELLKYLARYS